MIANIGPSPDFLKDGKTQKMDADGMVLLIGLIEGYTHTIGNRYGVEEFIK